ncbi:hypothetical protein [Allosaccharopolyspora coralli]|uniref:hypothetical protein n=1 Tax=Allosaccharopolyspora coralli TaxID=2665642 RepID=UPI001E316CF6|nr:hypothetical protein [Allosaccharopolyspora coralli]
MNDNWGPPSHTSYLDVLHTLVCKEAPTLFALCRAIDHRRSANVEYWGLSFPHHATVVHPDGGAHGSFQSAASAHHLFSTAAPLHLVWP